MFAKVAERKMRVVRGLLLAGWLVLIGSLFYDPVSAHWTDPNNFDSPFRIAHSTYQLRGETIPIEPYQMGNRIFWTMIVPILPMFLLVFGHEAWRRICPLSFVSQLPRYFGIQRRRSVLQRRTGAIEAVRHLVGRGSWLERNAWYVQFGLLFAGLSARLLIINSDRTALAIALIGVISAALLTGYLWDGKTWCNYFCPANVVQRIYTEPRGLLESAPHLQRNATPQSMCRTPGIAGKDDQTACVACTLNCGDIDLERSYWDTISSEPRRNVYYMFPGLVIGFYAYYLAYSGSWDYYFSGVWTHEAGAAGRLLSSGLLFGDFSVPIPKLVAAPLFLAVSVASSLLILRLLERGYRAIRLRRGRISEGEIRNHCLSFTAYVSFNIFYQFGGRPNLLLLPSYVLHVIDVLIIIASTLWLLQALSRTQLKYRRESMAMGLLAQLRNLKVEIGKYFEGRSLEELRPDELYVVSKVLPAFSHEHKLTAYRNLLEDAISNGKVTSASFLQVLAEMRGQLEISDEEHGRILEQLGTTSDISFDAQAAMAQEKAQCLEKYAQLASAAIILQVVKGRSVVEAADSAELEPVIRVLRASLQITDSEHAAALARLVSRDGAVAATLESRLQDLKDLCAARFCLEANIFEEGFWSALESLLTRHLQDRIAGMLREMAALLAVLSDEAQAKSYAATMTALDRAACSILLNERMNRDASGTWGKTLSPIVGEILAGRGDGFEATEIPGLLSFRHADVIRASQDLEQCLHSLAHGSEPAFTALALAAFAHLDRKVAQGFAVELLTRENGTDHWMLVEMAEALTGSLDGVKQITSADYNVTVEDAGGERDIAFIGSSLTVGCGVGNNIVLNGADVAPYHLTLYSGLGGIRLVRLDEAPLRVNGVKMTAASMDVDGTARVTFGDAGRKSPVLSIRPTRGASAYRPQPCDAATRLVWLAQSRMFQGADLAALARLARVSEVRRYPAQASLFKAGDPADEALILLVGEVRELSGAEHAGRAREWPRLVGLLRVSSAQVSSDFAIVIAVKGDAADLDAGAGTRPAGVKAISKTEKIMEVDLDSDQPVRRSL